MNGEELSAAGPGRSLERQVAERLGVLRERIAASGRDPASVKVVAVTKGLGSDVARAALACGLTDLGENYASELATKAAEVSSHASPGAPVPRWHFLGKIHRRDARKVAAFVSCWQSLASLHEAETLAAVAPGADVLVQVDVAGLPGRNGCRPGEVGGIVRGASGLGLSVIGLMAVGPPGEPDEALQAFEWLAGMAHEMGLAEVSMGMSEDLETALRAGATMVRVGRALFGPRVQMPAR